MTRSTVALASLTLSLLAAFPAAALLPGADFDGDGYSDRTEQILASNPYLASDDPLDVGLNAVFNGGFELNARDVQQATLCQVTQEHVLVAGIVYVTPCYQSVLRSPGWSTQQLSTADAARTAQVVDRDGDGDLEMAVPSPAINGHSFYQAFANPQQAFRGDARKLSFDLETGTPTPGTGSGVVIISYSQSPYDMIHPWVPIYVECSLTFSSTTLLAGSWTPYGGPKGGTYWHVEIGPEAAPMRSYWPGCDATAAEYNAANAQGRRDILTRLRPVQTSFWNFDGQVVDNVGLRGSLPAVAVPTGDLLPLA